MLDTGLQIGTRRAYILTADDVIPIERGGTGAINAVDALANLRALRLSAVGVLVLPGGETAFTIPQTPFLSTGIIWIGNSDGVTPAKMLLSNVDFSAGTTIQPETYHNDSPILKVMNQSGTALPRVGTPVNATGQTANIATTNLLVAPTAGKYRIEVLQSVTTAAAVGTLATTLGWTDRNGAQTSAVPSGTLSLVGTGNNDGSKVIEVVSGNVTYSTALVGVVGSPVYTLFISVTRLL